MGQMRKIKQVLPLHARKEKISHFDKFREKNSFFFQLKLDPGLWKQKSDSTG